MVGKKIFALSLLASTAAVALAFSISPSHAQGKMQPQAKPAAQTAAPAASAASSSVAIDNDDIGGVVTGPNGPEAGVWVVAETHDLPTHFIRIVVTDDQGRYVVPDLPKANYDVWVRGYGLVDSPKVKSAPGSHLDLKAIAAPDDKAAAQYYPAIYWYSMLNIPQKKDFG